jgi:succinate dehydrogenase/fumarate reductase flavoprotein subunit
MLDFGSSLFDLAVFRESQAGRKVYMDFNRNPLAVPGDADFALDRLDADVQFYLKKAGALLEKPLDRLSKMNPLSIELYKRYKYDITRDTLEFAVNNQHMNGGLAVDAWGATNVAGCYAIGEAAGTHGVTRPGGAALNAGQVFGTRCAEHIAARGVSRSPPGSEAELVDGAVARVLDVLKPDSGLSVGAVRIDVQARMSDHAGILCNANDVRSALDAARALNASIRQRGLAYEGAAGALRALQWQQTALLSEAVLTALAFYIEHRGGSRGARAICAPNGDCTPEARTGPLADFRFVSERLQDRAEQIHIRLRDGIFDCRTQPVRRRNDGDPPFFERDWPDFLTGAIYDGAR